jgi:hypothetical protein
MLKQGDEEMVTLLATLMVTLVPQHRSKAVGGSNVQPVPHSTNFKGAQVMIGGLVSMIETVSVQKAVFEQQSIAAQVNVMTRLH